MFRITIRELFLVTAIAGMGVAWGIEHKSRVTAREDATFLARYGDPFRGACGNMVGTWYSVANKYWERTPEVERNYVIVTEDDGTLRLDYDP
jgi:hypothetical protein